MTIFATANGGGGSGKAAVQTSISQDDQNPSHQKPHGEDAPQSKWTNSVDTADNTVYSYRSSSLPFGQHIALENIDGPTYVTAQMLVQQVVYTCSDRIFSFSPETFDLDIAARHWDEEACQKDNDQLRKVTVIASRTGGGLVAQGCLWNDRAGGDIQQASFLGTPTTLLYARHALEGAIHGYTPAGSPTVALSAHIAAADYVTGQMVTDYVTTMQLAEELGMAMICSMAAYEVQHMSVLVTALSKYLPSIHTYDGITVARETTRVIDAMSTGRLEDLRVTLSLVGLSNGRSEADMTMTLLSSLNTECGTDYRPFEYHGHSDPHSVMVLLGSVEATLGIKIATELVEAGHRVGVVVVRIYRPFIEEAFLETISRSSNLQSITVLGQVNDAAAAGNKHEHSPLYGDVLAAILLRDEQSSPRPRVLDHKYARETTFDPASISSLMLHALKSTSEETLSQDFGQLPCQQFVFWDVSSSSTKYEAAAIARAMAQDSAENVTMKCTYNDVIQGGISRIDVRTSKLSVDAPWPITLADATFVGDIKLVQACNVVASIRSGGKLVIRAEGLQMDGLEKHILPPVRQQILAKDIQLYLFDSSQLASHQNESQLLQAAFFRLLASDSQGDGDRPERRNGFRDIAPIQHEDAEKILRLITIPESWKSASPEAKNEDLTTRPFHTTSFAGCDITEHESDASLQTWQSSAKALLFKEAYGTKDGLRPDLTVKTFEVTVKENRRLTPKTYDRNIFHIEFDLGESGLKYEIGEALGIHAENNHDEVKAFMKWYDLDPRALVELPSREDPEVLETRTVYQSLIHNIDIFGKPPKRFYESLAEFATDSEHKKNLLALAGAEGAGEFKRRSEVDTVTYFDVLQEFYSARPAFHDLARIVSPMKRREYSIASAQAVTPTSIALMIVVVSWVDPQGRDRFGQATKYLSNLAVGAKVTVSVKPSVMKLPASSTTPLIMAGLGTGLAPFRAFVQQRALQKSQGQAIGPILLYMGSRHQREEYLYGEEWEAYRDAGVITLLGRAFSRDQARKVYIQDRMRETLADLVAAYCRAPGAFYLCGPTWPVPDVQRVLEEAIAADAAARQVKRDPAKEIERLKEAGRYVLEVY